jgi:hypothetical protein
MGSLKSDLQEKRIILITVLFEEIDCLPGLPVFHALFIGQIIGPKIMAEPVPTHFIPAEGGAFFDRDVVIPQESGIPFFVAFVVYESVAGIFNPPRWEVAFAHRSNTVARPFEIPVDVGDVIHQTGRILRVCQTVIPVVVTVLSRGKADTGGCADGILRYCPAEPDALAGQAVEVGGFHPGALGVSQTFGVVFIGEQEKDVWL